MDNRVYYGEYSLWHWIELVLKQNIILPEYQRYFVWNEMKVKTLIETFRKKQFVPPVTIGAFKFDGTTQNLILDGQQRLTSILLAYLDLYPDKKNFKIKMDEIRNQQVANDNDDEQDDESQFDNILEWNVRELTKKGITKDVILTKVVGDHYKSLDLDIDRDFLESIFLGFSYIVPQVSNDTEQQKYYSSVFRNINIQGEQLLPQESRRSLYFLGHNLDAFFSPDFSNNILINDAKVDFIRYLSLLSQYHKEGSSDKVARNYKSKMEKYYEEYIYASVNDEDSIYGKFSNVFPDKKYTEPFSAFKTALESLNLKKPYTSIIDADTYLFGSIYQVIFKNKKIDLLKRENLEYELEQKIKEFKGIPSHKKTPNNLGNLRERMSQSISIYERYITNESQ